LLTLLFVAFIIALLEFRLGDHGSQRICKATVLACEAGAVYILWPFCYRARLSWLNMNVNSD
jgi:hypothetical protein